MWKIESWIISSQELDKRVALSGIYARNRNAKSDIDDIKVATPFFRSATYFSLTIEDFSEHNINEALQKLNAAMEKFMREGSSWYVKTCYQTWNTHDNI